MSTQVSKIALESKNNSNVSDFEASSTVYGICKMCEAHQKVLRTQSMDFEFMSHTKHMQTQNRKTGQKQSNNTNYEIHKLCCELTD